MMFLTGSPHSECLQKALVSAQLAISLLEMKAPGDKAKAYQQALQKYVQVSPTILCKLQYSL